jgi:hypothetical protein
MAFDLVELAKDAQGLDPELAAQMAQDADEWQKQGRDTDLDGDTPESGDQTRDEHGRFTSQESEGDKPDADQAGDAAPANDEKPDASQPAEQLQAKEHSTETKKDEAEKQQQEQGKSKWAREQERKAKSWEELNNAKEQFRLEREQFEAQQKSVSVKDEAGFTAAQYQDAAAKFASKAQAMRQRQLEAEARGDFEAAEKIESEADRHDTLAKNASERAGTLSATGPNAAWSRLAQDLPEALQRDSQMFSELRKAIRGNPSLMADPFGPYRAAVQIGRKALGETKAALSKAQADAAQVPKLSRQVEELTAKVRELTRLTSLEGEGGIMSREGSEGRRFEDLSIAEMESQLANLIG